MKYTKEEINKAGAAQSAEELQKPVELTDEEAGAANGGMKILLTDYPKFLRPFLRFFFKVKDDTDDE